MGRVSAALVARGHRVHAVEPDPALVARSRAIYPEVEVEEVDIAGHARPEWGYDLIVAVGNVLIFLAEDSERATLEHLRHLLAPAGRILAGFHLTGRPTSARDYPVATFRADLAAAGLQVQHHFGGYDLRPPGDDYAVWVLTAEGRS